MRACAGKVKVAGPLRRGENADDRDAELARLKRDIRDLKDRQEILDCIVREAAGNAGLAAFFRATAHNPANHTCEIDGDVASCETYVVGTLLSKDQPT